MTVAPLVHFVLTGWVCEADGSAEGFVRGRETRASGAGAPPAWGARGDVSGAEPGVVCAQENRGPQSHHQRTAERQATGTYYLNRTINALQKDKLLVRTRIGNLGWNCMIQWWFVYPDTFVPGQYFRINDFSGLLNPPLVWDVKIVSHTFCPDLWDFQIIGAQINKLSLYIHLSKTI